MFVQLTTRLLKVDVRGDREGSDRRDREERGDLQAQRPVSKSHDRYGSEVESSNLPTRIAAQCRGPQPNRSRRDTPSRSSTIVTVWNHNALRAVAEVQGQSGKFHREQGSVMG
jgi:hypothetical protein